MYSVGVCLTSYNRKEKTLSCLDSLCSQESYRKTFDYQIYLVDDASTDGTAEAVQSKFPEVRIIPGTGDLFWNRGMHLAFGQALLDNHEFYLWINDDTTLFSLALIRLLDTSSRFKNGAIIIASTKDPQSGECTYGGLKRLDPIRRLKFTRIPPSDEPISVEVMNGNCVLIPKKVAEIVGNLDPVFSHGMGDYDYALRAKKKGVELYLAPGYFGYCPRNTNFSKNETFKQRFLRNISKKGLPPRDWAVFAKRYAGPAWPIYWLSPYIRRLFQQ